MVKLVNQPIKKRWLDIRGIFSNIYNSKKKRRTNPNLSQYDQGSKTLRLPGPSFQPSKCLKLSKERPLGDGVHWSHRHIYVGCLVNILLMVRKSGNHLFIYRILYMSGGAGFLPSIVVGKYPNAGCRRLVATSDHQ